MEKKDKFYIGMLGGLIIVVLLLCWKIGIMNKNTEDMADDFKKSVIKNDKLQKEDDGRYAKLVDYYKTEKELKNELKETNKELYNTVKKQGERILSLTTAVITLQGKVDEGTATVNSTDTNKIDLALKYPNDTKPFIMWNGSIDRRSLFYKGDWSFGQLPLQIVLTEEKRGTWKSRLIGPDWLIVDSMQINSLPAESYTPTVQRKIQFLVGAGYNRTLSNTGSSSIGIGLGLNLYDKHNIILNTNTNKEVGIHYYYKFQSFKRRKK